MAKNFYEKFKYLTVLGACKQGKFTWAVDRYTNSLYRLDEENRDLQFIANLEVNSEYAEAEYTHMVENDGVLFMMPQNSYFISVYDTCSHDLKKMELPCKKDGTGYGVVGEIIYQGYLYIFSCYEKYAPYKINLTNLEIVEEREWCAGLRNLKFPRSKYLLSRVIAEKDRIIFGVYNTEMVLSYMLTTKKFERLCRLDGSIKIDKVVGKHGNSVYLSSVDCNEIYKVNLEDDSLERIPVKFWETGNSVINVLDCGTDIYLLPKLGDRIVRYDINKKIMERVKWDVSVLAEEKLERCFFYGYIEGQEIVLYLYTLGSRIRIDRKTGSTIQERLDKNPKKNALEILKHDYWEQLEGEQMESYSEEICPLSVYINRKFTLLRDSVDTHSNIGNKIWKNTMGE